MFGSGHPHLVLGSRIIALQFRSRRDAPSQTKDPGAGGWGAASPRILASRTVLVWGLSPRSPGRVLQSATLQDSPYHCAPHRRSIPSHHFQRILPLRPLLGVLPSHFARCSATVYCLVIARSCHSILLRPTLPHRTLHGVLLRLMARSCIYLSIYLSILPRTTFSMYLCT